MHARAALHVCILLASVCVRAQVSLITMDDPATALPSAILPVSVVKVGQGGLARAYMPDQLGRPTKADTLCVCVCVRVCVCARLKQTGAI